MGSVAPTAFELWFQEFVAYAGPIMNLLYWLVMIIAALWAVMLFKRLVDFKTGVAQSGDDAPAASKTVAKGKTETVDIEEFVE